MPSCSNTRGIGRAAARGRGAAGRQGIGQVAGWLVAQFGTLDGLRAVLNGVRSWAARTQRAVEVTVGDKTLMSRQHHNSSRISSMPSSPSSIPAPELPPGPRHALLVATTTYSDPSCNGCGRQARDAADLTKVLADPGIGGFAVTSVINKPARAILLAVEDFLADRGTGDLLLVYLSCHGVLDDRRRLFFAAKDTRKDRLGATGVESAWVRDQLEHCRARSQIVILDSCFSGAFGKGEGKGDDDLDLKGRLKGNGHGRIVLTASAATESATRPRRPRRDRFSLPLW